MDSPTENSLPPSPSLDLLREVARVEDDAPPADLSGRIVGRYRLLRLLGAGGMGVVYAAEDQTLARTVAVKLLRRDRTHDETRRRRFLREARLASAVNHPNVAAVYDVGVAEDEGVFIAMELCEGKRLRAYAAERKLDAAEVVRIGLGIARALDAAHRRGVIHRDLKPDNVIIGEDGTVKVLDFGVAKILNQTDPSGPRPKAALAEEELTVDGGIMGTPSYMSPEQARGDEIDARSDVYSLGVVLFEIATGARPRAPGALAHQIDGRVPVALSRVIARCLAEDPIARFASAREVEEALLRAERTTLRRFARPVAVAFVIALTAIAATIVVTAGEAPAPVAREPHTPTSSRVVLADSPGASVVLGATPSASATNVRANAAPPAARPSATTHASATASSVRRPPRHPLDEQK